MSWSSVFLIWSSNCFSWAGSPVPVPARSYIVVSFFMTSFPSSSMISILLFSVILCFLRRWAGIVICPLLVTLPAVILFHCITCLLVLRKGVVLFKDLLWGSAG